MTTPLGIDQVIVIWFLACAFLLLTVKYTGEYKEIRKERYDFYSRKTERYDKLKEEEADRYRSRLYSGDPNK